MKRFHFSLEKILELRKYREQLAKQDLAKVNSRVGSLENQIRDCHTLQAMTLDSRSQEEFDLALWMAGETYYQGLKGKIEQNQNQLVGFYEEREKVLRLYKDKAKDRKVLEKLKEKKNLEHKQELQKEDQKSLDDVVNASHHRQERE